MAQVAPLPPPDPFVHFMQSLPPGVVVLIVGGMLTVTAFVVAPLVRAIARRIEGGGGQAQRQELEELRHRVMELESGQHRVAELEERLDFSERVLAGQRNSHESDG